MATISDYLRLVKFSHTIFAMPFALLSFTYAWQTTEPQQSLWLLLLQVVGCMVFARNVAMGFNRWADRKIDAENPRTAGREIPAGKISARGAMWFVVVNALLFIAVAATINPLCGWLSPVALFVVMFYSYCKRFTSLAHRLGHLTRHRSCGCIYGRYGHLGGGVLVIGTCRDDLVRRI